MEDEGPIYHDDIEGIAPPAKSRMILGHNEALSRMMEAYASGRMHHAWLLSGPRGIGKATLAFCFARHILSGDVDYNPSGWPETLSGQVAQNAHPNLLHLTRPWDERAKKFKSQLTVDEVRRIQSHYQMTAGAGGWRISIIDSADDMNRNAANALLKMLEEPPKQSLFLVVNHAGQSLLPTIRSRCVQLSLNPLAEQVQNDILANLKNQAADEPKEQAIALSGGSVRRSLQLLGDESLKAFAEYRHAVLLGREPPEKAWLTAHSVGDTMTRKGREESYRLFIDLTLDWIGNRVRDLADETPLAQLATWAEVWEKAARTVQQANTYNLDRKQVILSLTGILLQR